MRSKNSILNGRDGPLPGMAPIIRLLNKFIRLRHAATVRATERAELERLAKTAPHLLDDVGLQSEFDGRSRRDDMRSRLFDRPNVM